MQLFDWNALWVLGVIMILTTLGLFISSAIETYAEETGNELLQRKCNKIVNTFLVGLILEIIATFRFF